MRILVLDIAASSGGAMSILKSFYSYVKNNCEEHEWIFFLGDKYLQDTNNIKIVCFPEVKKSKIQKIKFDFLRGRKEIEKYCPDVIFSLQNIAIFGTKLPQVVYLHQSIPFQKEKKFSFFKREERMYAVYQYIIGAIIKKSLKKANYVITQTNWLKRAVCEKTKVEENKILVSVPLLEKDIKLSNYKCDWNKTKFIYPTSNAIYKNIDCILEADKILKNRNVSEYSIEITVNLENSFPSKNIHYIGYIEHEKLMEKLTESTLIMPSYIESLCLPLVESRSVSGVILASNCAFSKEILSDYENAYLFNPFEPKELADLMEKVIEGKIKQKMIDNKFELKGSWREVIDILEKQV